MTDGMSRLRPLTARRDRRVHPTWVEVTVTAGIWAMGLFILTALVKVALPIEMGTVRSPLASDPDRPRRVSGTNLPLDQDAP